MKDYYKIDDPVDLSNYKYGIITQCPKLKNIVKLIEKLALIDCSILFLGETGVGKTSFASICHFASLRKSALFVDINAASIPEPLFESLLFGHEKGSFTDAFEKNIGKVVLANEGTLFIDEIADLSAINQNKIVTLLDKQEVTPLGSQKVTKVNVRYLFATNKPLDVLVKQGCFRQDLFFRIANIPITIPPLREHREDIEMLLTYFAHKFSIKYKKPLKGYRKKILDLLVSYDWPGNMREFIQCIERSIILLEGDFLECDHIMHYCHSDTRQPTLSREAIAYLDKKSLPEALSCVEQLLIEEKMRNHHSKSALARQCGISRQTLRSKLKKYKIL